MTTKTSEPQRNELMDFLQKAVGLDSVSEKTRNMLVQICKKTLEHPEENTEEGFKEIPLSKERHYQDFKTLSRLETLFGFATQKCSLFPHRTAEPSDWLRTALNIGFDIAIPFGCEKARTEFLTVPLLCEIKQSNEKRFSLFSGEWLHADAQSGLTGKCDFMLVKGEAVKIKAPVFAIMKTAYNITDSEIAVCVSQLIGAREYNETHHHTAHAVFGCVSTGEVWQFLRLEKNMLYVDNKRYYIDNLTSLLGAFQTLADV